jgi:hypothetical protein
MVLLEGFCSEYLSTTARSKGIGKIFYSVISNTKEHAVWYLHLGSKSFPTVGQLVGT